MSDDLDRASEIEQQQRDDAIAKARIKQKTLYTGRCLWCNDTIHSGLFCNIYCHEDYESEQIIKKKQYR